MTHDFKHPGNTSFRAAHDEPLGAEGDVVIVGA